MKSNYIFFYFLSFLILFSCTDEESVSTDDSQPAITYISSPILRSIEDLENSNCINNHFVIDIFGNGKTALAFVQQLSCFSFMGSYFHNSYISGITTIADNEYFQIDSNLVVEVLQENLNYCDTNINAFDSYALGFTFVGNNSFNIPLDDFSFSAYLAGTRFFGNNPSTCSTNAYQYNPFLNTRYIIFRVKNLTNNSSRYGWLKVSATSTPSGASLPVLYEYAYSNEDDVIIPPGYY